MNLARSPWTTPSSSSAETMETRFPLQRNSFGLFANSFLINIQCFFFSNAGAATQTRTSKHPLISPERHRPLSPIALKASLVSPALLRAAQHLAHLPSAQGTRWAVLMLQPWRRCAFLAIGRLAALHILCSDHAVPFSVRLLSYSHLLTQRCHLKCRLQPARLELPPSFCHPQRQTSLLQLL